MFGKVEEGSVICAQKKSIWRERGIHQGKGRDYRVQRW